MSGWEPQQWSPDSFEARLATERRFSRDREQSVDAGGRTVTVWPQTWTAMAMDDHRTGATAPIPALVESAPVRLAMLILLPLRGI